MNDEEIIKQILYGQAKSFALLVEKYQQKIFVLCYRLLQNKQDSEDIAQEIFLKVYQKLTTFNQQAKFSTWLYRVAVNTCYDYLRKDKGKTKELEWEKIELKEKGPEDKLAEKESLREIEQAIGNLNAEQQVIMNLRLYNELSYEQIAQIMGITPEAAKMRYYRARISLQKDLLNRKRKEETA